VKSRLLPRRRRPGPSHKREPGQQCPVHKRRSPQIEITFNKDLKPASVNPNTVILTRSGTKVPGNVTFNSPSKKATFKPNALLGPGDYKITVLGSGPQHVIDVDNLALDGDANGTAGGDFSSKFLVQRLA